MHRICLVDDSKLLCDLLAHVLHAEGYEVTIANGGLEAWNLISRHFPDLLILDIQMPDLDGLSVLQMVRTLPNGQCLPVIILSGEEMADSVVKARKLGARQYVLKNHCLVQELLARVRQIMPQGAAEPGTA